MQEKKIIAIFGGSFNPPLNSHIQLAKEIIYNSKKIEKIYFVPVSTKYQKQGLIEDKHRYNMLKLGCENENRLDVSDIELKSSHQLYSIQTLEFFKNKYKDNYIYFILGTDNLKELEMWKESEKILKEYKIIVLEREKDKLEDIIKDSKFLQKYKYSLIKIENLNRIYLSSTAIRNKIKNGECVEEYIPKKILDYIIRNKLYI